MDTQCKRCHEPTSSTIGSMFNTDMICIPCKKKEEAHPQYQEARDTEMAEVQKGNYNYPGIGLPKDL